MKFNKKRLLKRLGLGAGALAVIVAGVAGFSAFESHIINVTARIENALAVNTEALDFGTVFPQEHLFSREIPVTLSDSFLGEDRADDIDYVIKQKPKVKDSWRCAEVVEEAGTEQEPSCDPNIDPIPGDPYETLDLGEVFQGPAWQYCEEFLPENAPYGEYNSESPYWEYCFLPLANYLSKTEGTTDGQGENDTSIPAFHHAYEWTGDPLRSSLDEAFIAGGRLAKSEGDEDDSWVINLAVPCFVNHCAQDWDEFVLGINPEVEDSSEFMLPEELEHLVFGTDLWIEVTGVSRVDDEPDPERPEVGAALGDYEQSTGEDCDVNVDSLLTETATSSATINGGIAAADPGDTVCVDDGTYTENVVIDKNVDLEGAGPTLLGSVINGDVAMSADDAEIRGFLINGNVSSDFHNITIEFNTILPLTGGNGIEFGGTSGVGSTISNNVVTTFALTSPNNRGIYLDQNGTTGFIVEFNTVTARKSGFGDQGTSGTVMNNVFNGYDVAGVGWEVSHDAAETAPVISTNNFNESPGIGVANLGDTTFDAPSNWWGDASSAGNISGTMTTSDDQASAYPEN